MPLPPAPALLVGAIACSVLLGLPQAIRLWRTRDVTGIAPTQDLLRVVTKVAWVAYALAMADPGLAAAQAIALPSLVTLVLLRRGGSLPTRLLVSAIATAAVVTGASLATGAVALLGTTATLVDIGRYLPQAYRALTSDELTGVAAGTYLLQMAASVCWMGYGHLQGLPPLVWGNAIILPVAGVILVRVLVSRRRRG